MQRREQPVDLVDGKGLGIKIIADPVAHFLMPFVVGVTDGLYQIVESGDASTIFRWTRKLTIGADRIRRIRIRWKPLLQDDPVLPAIAQIIRVESLGVWPHHQPGQHAATDGVWACASTSRRARRARSKL
jgi:hypothetical protein